ncbi:MAG: tetratricopeptide repeat protein [PVC group bacterium]|nr:tetratricopeptide repeat protein [PVC group bacterium]
MKHKTLTIVFADVQGFTSRTGRQTREQNELFLKEISSFVKKHVKNKGGVLVKTMGDGFLITFDSPTDAVACGQQMQKEIELRNANIMDQDKFIKFHIGICTGEVTVDDNKDVHGDAVNIAARIESFAGPNDVYIGEATYLAMNKSEINALDLGPQRFKNVVQEVRVYKVTDGKTDFKDLAPKKSRNKTALIAGIVIVVGIIILSFFLSRKPEQIAEVRLPADNRQNDDSLQRQKLDRLMEFVDSYERNEEYSEAIQVLGQYITKETDKDLKELALLRLKGLERRIEERKRREEEEQQQREDEQQQQKEDERRAEELRQREEELERRTEIGRQAEEDRRNEELERRDEELRRREEELERRAAENRNSSGGMSQNQSNNRSGQQKENPRQLLQSGKYDEVIDLVKERLKRNPNNPQLYILAGQAYFKKQQYSQAEQYFQDAVDLNPNNPIVYQGLASVYEQSGEIQDAISMLRKLIDIEPSEHRREKARQQIERLERRL